MVEPLLLQVKGKGPGGRPLEHSKRVIVNAILYVTRSGCSSRMLPTDFPPWQTVYRYFAAWRDDGTVDVVHDALRAEVRTRSKKKAGGTREVTPSAASSTRNRCVGPTPLGQNSLLRSIPRPCPS